jgi:hypothetical protein
MIKNKVIQKIIYKWIELFIGVVVVFLGVSVLRNPTFSSWKYGTISFGKYHNIVGFIILFIGIWILLLTFKNIYFEIKNEEN